MTRRNQAQYRKTQAARGLVQVAEWIPAEHKAMFKAVAEALRTGQPVTIGTVTSDTSTATTATVTSDTELDQILATLPEKTRAIMAERFQQKVREATAEETQRLSEREQAVKAQEEFLNKRAAGITPLMTREEFNQVRGFLHPDRHQENHDKARQAFQIFNRLLETISPHIPKRVRCARGWD